jgi:hypothetical protein
VGPLKWLSLVVEYTGECLCLKVDRSITSEGVIDPLATIRNLNVPWKTDECVLDSGEVVLRR